MACKGTCYRFINRFLNANEVFLKQALLFQNNIRFTEDCKDYTESSHALPHPISPIINILHQCSTFVTINKLMLIDYQKKTGKCHIRSPRKFTNYTHTQTPLYILRITYSQTQHTNDIKRSNTNTLIQAHTHLHWQEISSSPQSVICTIQ